jgi:2-amino-4-hydroxy-6-hydroxymethyldihydropteridine diphosphokinase
MPKGHTVYLSLGSNVGDRASNLARAIEALEAAGVRVLRRSSLYATEPVDFRTQGWFLNCVVEAETEWMPRQLLAGVQRIELGLGRRRMAPRGPRTIDIDILLFGSSVVRMPDLELPHPRLAARRFVLAPLAEIAPALQHPTLCKTIAELLRSTADRSLVRRWQAAPSSSAGPGCEQKAKDFC